jgi:hypothetical protein
MKNKIFYLSLMLALVLISCNEKNEVKQDNLKEEKEEKINPNSFKVIFNVIVKKDDKFHLYYTEDGTINFPEEKSIWVDVKGQEYEQDVVFNFPEDVIPTQLRIDFNTNQKDEAIQINNFKMTYYGKVFEAPGIQFFDYFGPNLETVTIIDEDKVIFKPLNSDNGRYAPPSFYPSQEALKNRIDQITQ